MRRGSALEEILAHQIRALRLPAPIREYEFCPGRKWRADFAWPERLLTGDIGGLAVEVDGGTWINGAHNRGAGTENDQVKQAAYAMLGWRVLRVGPTLVRSGHAVRWIALALAPDAKLLFASLPSPKQLLTARRGTR